jgi:hypothetical protein
MDRIAVISSTIRSIGYDAESAVLEVEFQSGKVYQYTGVPPHTYDGIMRADSKGRYLNAQIKERFPCRQVA